MGLVVTQIQKRKMYTLEYITSNYCIIKERIKTKKSNEIIQLLQYLKHYYGTGTIRGTHTHTVRTLVNGRLSQCRHTEV